MHSHQDTSKLSTNIIYKLAKEKNELALTKLVSEGECVSAFIGSFNSIMLLAKEGDWDATDFLINKFNANTNHLLFGAGWGGHTKIIQDLIESAWISYNYAIKGAAYGGNLLLVENLLDRGACIHDAAEGAAMGGHEDILFILLNRGANIDMAVRGAATSGNGLLTYKLLAQGASNFYAAEGAARSKSLDLLNSLFDQAAEYAEVHNDKTYLSKVFANAIIGAAYSGNQQLTYKLMNGTDGLNEAIYGAACGGHLILLISLLSCHTKTDKRLLIIFALIAASIEGHYDIITKLISDNIELNHSLYNYAALGAATGGNIQLVNNFIDLGVDMNFIARGAARGHQIGLLNNIMENYIIDYDEIVEQMKKSVYLNNEDRLRFISFINSQKLRVALAKHLEKIDPTIDADYILKKSTKLNYLMNEHQMPYSQARGYLFLLSDSGFSWLLLQGNRFISEQKFPFELYLKMINSMIDLGNRVLNNEDVEHIYNVAHMRLRDSISAEAKSGFFSFFKISQQAEPTKEVNDCYKKRMSY